MSPAPAPGVTLDRWHTDKIRVSGDLATPDATLALAHEVDAYLPAGWVLFAAYFERWKADVVVIVNPHRDASYGRSIIVGHVDLVPGDLPTTVLARDIPHLGEWVASVVEG